MDVVLYVAACGLLSGISAYFMDRLQSRRRWKVVVAMLVAMASLAATVLLESKRERDAEPVASVTTDERKNLGSVAIHVSIDQGTPTEIGFYYLLVGQIDDIKDRTLPGDAESRVFRAGLPEDPFVENAAAIRLRPISGRQFDYEIRFRRVPWDGPLVFSGDTLDRFKVTYSWMYKGALKQRERWYSRISGLEVSPAKGTISAAAITKGGEEEMDRYKANHPHASDWVQLH